MKNVLERILNLLAFLLTVGHPVTAADIRTTVAGYDQASDEAFRRMFERDKDLLRSMGVPLRTVPTDAWDVEVGYVVPPEAYQVPAVDLTDEERTALWLAAQAVRLGGRPAGPEAVLKLGGVRTAAGLEPLGVDLGSESETLGDLFLAIGERRKVTFDYRSKNRTVDPYALGHRRGHWYLVAGTETGRRSFRIDRMSEVALLDKAGAFDRPTRLDVSAVLDARPWEIGRDDALTATVEFDADVAWWAARRLSPAAEVTHGPEGSVVARLDVANVEAFIGWVLTFGEHAVVADPEDLRARIVERVRGLA